jgi:hypothetical protein
VVRRKGRRLRSASWLRPKIRGGQKVAVDSTELWGVTRGRCSAHYPHQRIVASTPLKASLRPRRRGYDLRVCVLDYVYNQEPTSPPPAPPPPPPPQHYHDYNTTTNHCPNKTTCAPRGHARQPAHVQALTAARFDDIQAHVSFTGTGSKDSRLYSLWNQTQIWDPGD